MPRLGRATGLDGRIARPPFPSRAAPSTPIGDRAESDECRDDRDRVNPAEFERCARSSSLGSGQQHYAALRQVTADGVGDLLAAGLLAHLVADAVIGVLDAQAGRRQN